MIRFLSSAVLTLLLALPVAGAERRSLEATVVGVADGDTITVLDSNKLQHKIRLDGIDAPEKGQPFGERAKQSLSAFVYGKNVTLEWSKVDRYGRFVATVRVAPPGACAPDAPCNAMLNVNLAQIEAGLAWHYKQFEREQSPADRKTFAMAEEQARAQRIGLWVDPAPVQPWEWRHGPSTGPIKKSRADICHAPDMPTYPSVKKFTPFATLEECLESGGRVPR